MPLKLKPPREGKTKNYQIRGTHLGVYIDRTSGTPVEAIARQVLNKVKRDIERGALTDAPVEANEPAEKTFDEAALSYIKSGGDGQYLGTFDPNCGTWVGGVLSKLTGKTLPEITQQVIDECAVALYPTGSAATRNRQVYMPVSAVLKHAALTSRSGDRKDGVGKRGLTGYSQSRLSECSRQPKQKPSPISHRQRTTIRAGWICFRSWWLRWPTIHVASIAASRRCSGSGSAVGSTPSWARSRKPPAPMSTSPRSTPFATHGRLGCAVMPVSIHAAWSALAGGEIRNRLPDMSTLWHQRNRNAPISCQLQRDHERQEAWKIRGNHD